jgi:hypothetical protein
MQKLSSFVGRDATGSASIAAGMAGSTSIASDAGAATTSPFVININWDASVASAPSSFTTAVTKAVQFLEGQFSNPATITIDVGYGEIGGSALGGALGESSTQLNSANYSTLVNTLKSHATTAADQSAVATLPSSSPVSGTFWVTPAEAKALGLTTGSSLDGSVGFSDLVEMMAERGLSLAHTTIMRWVQHYTPEFEKRWHRHAFAVGRSWRVDETYVKIADQQAVACHVSNRQLQRFGDPQAGD